MKKIYFYTSTPFEGSQGNTLYAVLEANEDRTEPKILADGISLVRAHKMVKKLKGEQK